MNLNYLEVSTVKVAMTEAKKSLFLLRGISRKNKPDSWNAAYSFAYLIKTNCYVFSTFASVLM